MRIIRSQSNKLVAEELLRKMCVKKRFPKSLEGNL